MKKTINEETRCVEFKDESTHRIYNMDVYEKLSEGVENIEEFDNHFVLQNKGLIFFSGKSVLVKVTGMNCQQTGTYKSGKEFQYSTATFHFENGLVGRNVKNYTYDLPVEEGKEYEILYTVTFGKYNPKKNAFSEYRNIGIIGNRKMSKTNTVRK